MDYERHTYGTNLRRVRCYSFREEEDTLEPIENLSSSNILHHYGMERMKQRRDIDNTRVGYEEHKMARKEEINIFLGKNQR